MGTHEIHAHAVTLHFTLYECRRLTAARAPWSLTQLAELLDRTTVSVCGFRWDQTS